jgi:hypothetical protein
MRRIIQAYHQILATEERLRIRQEKRDSMKLEAEVWIVHDKDTGEAIAIGNTKTMASKRARAVLIFPETKARKHSWLDLDKYSLRLFELV